MVNSVARVKCAFFNTRGKHRSNHRYPDTPDRRNHRSIDRQVRVPAKPDARSEGGGLGQFDQMVNAYRHWPQLFGSQQPDISNIIGFRQLTRYCMFCHCVARYRAGLPAQEFGIIIFLFLEFEKVYADCPMRGSCPFRRREIFSRCAQ